MKTSFSAFLLALLLLVASCKKESDSIEIQEAMGTERYNSLVFEKADASMDIAYGRSSTQNGIDQAHWMDVYQPSGDQGAMRPLVIFIHGGGFEGGDKADFATHSIYFARSGYVAATLNYRLLDVTKTETTIKQAVVDAVMDLKAAVRFFRQDAATNNVYRIDPNKIFAGGHSAGGFTALHAAYITTDAEITQLGGNSMLSYVNAQGGWEGSSGNPGYSSELNGVINLAGALFKADMVDAGEAPLFSIHGTEDEVVPFLSGDADNTGVITEGSGLIHPVADQVGIPNTLKSISGGDHGVPMDCETCLSDIRGFVFGRL